MIKKKVLVIGSPLSQFGGISNYVKSIMDNFNSNNYEMDFLGYKKFNSGKFILFDILSVLMTFFSIVFKVKKDKTTIVHIHTSGFSSFWRTCMCLIALKITSSKFILQMHSAEFDRFYASSSFLSRRLIELFLELPDKLIVLSDIWRSYYDTIAPNIDKEILPTFVNIPNISPELIKRNRNSNKVTNILFFGVLNERKGVLDILKICDELFELDNVSLTIAGSPRFEEKIVIEQLVEKSKVFKNRFKTELNVTDIRKDELYKQSDIYLLPTYAEGLPTTLLEAMSYSIPVITTGVGAIPEVIINEENGYIIDPGDKKKLFSCIRDLVLNNKKRQDFADKGYKLIQDKFTTEAIMARCENIYNITIGE